MRLSRGGISFRPPGQTAGADGGIPPEELRKRSPLKRTPVASRWESGAQRRRCTEGPSAFVANDPSRSRPTLLRYRRRDSRELPLLAEPPLRGEDSVRRGADRAGASKLRRSVRGCATRGALSRCRGCSTLGATCCCGARTSGRTCWFGCAFRPPKGRTVAPSRFLRTSGCCVTSPARPRSGARWIWGWALCRRAWPGVRCASAGRFCWRYCWARSVSLPCCSFRTRPSMFRVSRETVRSPDRTLSGRASPVRADRSSRFGR